MNMNLPTNVDAERFVLGSIMLDDAHFMVVSGSLEVNDFSLEKHRRIYKRMGDLHGRGESVDRITVHNELMKHGESESCDGLTYLVSLDDGLPQAIKIDDYIRIVKQKAVLRSIIFASEHMRNRAMMAEESPDEILSGMEETLANLRQATYGANKPISTSDMISELGITTLMSNYRQKGVRLPWTKLNDALSGASAGQMIVLMAATSRGKTSMALQVATCAASEGHTPVIWTMEMNPRALFQRMMTQLAGVYCGKHMMTFDERAVVGVAGATLNEKPIYFDTKSRNVGSFIASLRMVKSKARLGIAIVDYLQLIRGSGRNRAQEVSDNSRALKLAAMDLGIPFLVLCQVDRGSVKGEGRIGLHSGKESGDIENDADVVMWIEGGELSRDQDTTVSLHIGKQREGPAGFSIPMLFSPSSQTFSEVQE